MQARLPQSLTGPVAEHSIEPDTLPPTHLSRCMACRQPRAPGSGVRSSCCGQLHTGRRGGGGSASGPPDEAQPHRPQDLGAALFHPGLCRCADLPLLPSPAQQRPACCAPGGLLWIQGLLEPLRPVVRPLPSSICSQSSKRARRLSTSQSTESSLGYIVSVQAVTSIRHLKYLLSDSSCCSLQPSTNGVTSDKPKS